MNLNSLRRRSRTMLLLAAGWLLLAGGCVERTLIIRSDPPGADVIVNGRDVGMTPVQIPFETYGVFDVTLSAPRHHRLNAPVPVKAPWFQQAPLDFFTEVLWPFTLRDDHEVLLALTPYPESDDAGVDEREAGLRARLEGGEAPPETEQP